MYNGAKKIEDYVEIGLGAWLFRQAFRKSGPSKEEKKKAIAKRKLCTVIYFQGGKKYAKFEKKGVKWHEEIKHDPFHLY